MGMNIFVLADYAFTNPLNIFFGWMASAFYHFFDSYGLAIIFLTVVTRAALIPLNVRSQKSMLKQQALASQQAEIRRKYPDDKAKQNEEITRLLQANGASSFAGCLLPMLQLVFLLPIYAVVRGPLRYISGMSRDNLVALGELFNINAKQATDNNIAIINSLRESPEILRQAVSQGILKLEQLINMDFLGLDLSLTPSVNPTKIFGDDWRTNLPLLVIPLLVLLTTILQTRITNVLKPTRLAEKKAKEAKERAKNNPARKGQAAEASSMESSMKMMLWMMPVFMLFTTFMLPAAMAFYWIVGNIMGVIQQIIIFYMFTKPYEHKLSEMELLKAKAFNKNSAYAEDESSGSSKKKRKNNPQH